MMHTILVDTRYGQLSKHVRCRMAKYKVANSGNRLIIKDHVLGTGGRFVLETEN